MPVNLNLPESVQQVKGVRLSATAAGLKKNGNTDLVLITLPDTASTAGVFTRNAYCAAPVTVCRDHLEKSSSVRALLVNSGGANAATGELGEKNARETCAWVAELLSVDATSVLPFSTGVIGEQLPMDKIRSGIDRLVPALSNDTWFDAARGIMTTDISPKMATRTIELTDGTVTLTGFAKGSGMIQPNMATMLAYVFTDADLAPADVQQCLEQSVERSFNSITVDGDTSTNDSCILSATGQSGTRRLVSGTADWESFNHALLELCLELAQAVVRDGEGATKFITLQVNGGKDTDECKQVGLTVGNSPLVKTAFFASDANVGRIVMAVGRSGVDLDIDALSFAIGGVDVLTNGQPAQGYTDEKGQAVMAEDEITVTIELGRGDASWTVWACDFSHEYVSINADYRS